MEQQINNANLDTQQAETDEISLMEILFRYLKYWKWFVVSVVVALAVVFVYLRYTVPVYNVTSTIILKHEKDQRNSMAGLASIDALGGMMGGVSSVDNETYVIRSKTAVRTVVDRLNLHTSYIVEGRVRSSDKYTDSPFIVAMDGAGLDSLQQAIEFTAQMNEDKSISVSGTVGGEVIDTKLENLPGLLTTPQGVISFMLREDAKPYYKPLQITIGRPEATVNSYRANLTVQPASKTASVLTLSLKTAYPN